MDKDDLWENIALYSLNLVEALLEKYDACFDPKLLEMVEKLVGIAQVADSDRNCLD